MTRADLLALTDDDLAALANRGLVKRARRELENAELQADWREADDGTIEARWSDGPTVVLPGQATVREARCDCGAFELCRHVLRTVLAWQTRATDFDEADLPAAWDPGTMLDDTLRAHCAKGVWERAAALLEQGVLAELLRTAKPSARFHAPGHTVRYTVPGDARYAVCSCADPAPCVHAVLGVHVFRKLAPDLNAGLISLGPLDADIPPTVLAAADACLDDLLTDGLAAGSGSWRDRLRRVAAECAGSGLRWPAQLLEELALDFDRYQAGDASFDPADFVRRTGELLLRVEAIRAGRAPVPQAFIRGLRTDRDSDLGSSRLVGLGAGVRQERKSTTLSVVLQDLGSGNLLTLERTFAEEEPAARKPFHVLSQASAARDASLQQVARGQIVLQGGKRTAAGRLSIGRARSAVNLQSFEWNRLTAPVLAEDFGEVGARLQLLPPAPFRPRRAAVDFHVCPLAAVREAHFDPARNLVVAELADLGGATAWLEHPWSERGRGGAEALLRSLRDDPPRFISGWFSRRHGDLLVQPAAFVAERDGARQPVLPWIEPPGAVSDREVEASITPLQTRRAWYAAAAHLLEHLLLSGSRRLDSTGWPGWRQVALELESSGLHRGAALVRTTCSSPTRAEAARQLLKLVVLAESFE
ncbi:MAG: hypothetical protein JSR82_12705 [Verrucomicrobia bacterium]|nr:hypothetical protein [Verrucomicrobiota bacterium]